MTLSLFVDIHKRYLWI